MQPDDSVAQLIEKVKAGDELAARALWDRYFPQLVCLARRKLADHPTRMDDEEDVALSALASFMRAAANDRFPHLRDRAGLWRLLSAMTFRKAVDRIRHEQREKRRAEGESAMLDNGSQDGAHPMDGIAGPGPDPALETIFAEEFDRLLGLLDRELRKIALLKLDGHTNREIAQQCDCSPTTVERGLRSIRRKWGRELP